jgi:hypothetical protein
VNLFTIGSRPKTHGAPQLFNPGDAEGDGPVLRCPVTAGMSHLPDSTTTLDVDLTIVTSFCARDFAIVSLLAGLAELHLGRWAGCSIKVPA